MFVQNAQYLDRKGNCYVFLYKNGGVTVFQDDNGKLHCRNDKGLYRWDGKETEIDIG